MSRRFAAPLVVFVLVFAATQGAAATLGAHAGALGSGTTTIVGCGDTIEVSYRTEYDPALPGYVVSDVSTAGCESGEVDLVLGGDGGGALGQAGRGAAAAEVGTLHVVAR